MNLKKLAPWNWFTKGEEHGTALPIQKHGDQQASKYPLPWLTGPTDRPRTKRATRYHYLFLDVFRAI